VPPHCLPTSG